MVLELVYSHLRETARSFLETSSKTEKEWLSAGLRRKLLRTYHLGEAVSRFLILPAHEARNQIATIAKGKPTTTRERKPDDGPKNSMLKLTDRRHIFSGQEKTAETATKIDFLSTPLLSATTYSAKSEAMLRLILKAHENWHFTPEILRRKSVIYLMSDPTGFPPPVLRG